MSPTLVILAGGLGARFGGTKQLAPVGPNDETFFDFAIRDAAGSAISEVIIVARSDIDELLRDHLVSQNHSSSAIRIAHQDTFGPPRSKPWGTGHAVLCAAAISSGPVVVLNADDYYGPNGATLAAHALPKVDTGRATLVAYELAGTLSPTGSVSRGICEVEDTHLVGLVETHGIRKEGGLIRSEKPSGSLPADALVSMNLWGLPRSALEQLDQQWQEFHSLHTHDASTEFLLPVALEEQRERGLLAVDVVRSREKWMGITNPDDLAMARRAFVGDS
ncbi:MAG: NTP transferase domain-containing protein [Acidimicrobiales bacterium]|nr:hypothetical protein [Acidimicrobiaceae bacterium]MDP6076846.1 NTP transferase domain-containing protein [Acidimicrobiales bacterium]HCV35361.1 hypothetical protein [Acidimicrobiaceae bacterium]HJO79636.1 NTP transferase domain-containing protein [Acidimicrobiales bacterium]|tara:strand:+ start:7980 stop:8810 length:831 start_codon:yes stop_codon:yes gene_type:complete